jgi:hypothetical protein
VLCTAYGALLCMAMLMRAEKAPCQTEVPVSKRLHASNTSPLSANLARLALAAQRHCLVSEALVPPALRSACLPLLPLPCLDVGLLMTWPREAEVGNTPSWHAVAAR